MKTKITLSGYAGVGKSSVGRIIQEKLNFEFVSVGQYSRKVAEEHGMTINEFQLLCKTQPDLDKSIDEKFRKECNSKDHLIIDYRLGFHFIEKAFHVLLKASDDTASKRINNDKRSNEATSAKDIAFRNQRMKNRFIEIYEVDFTDEIHYDLVLVTDTLSADEVSEKIIESFERSKECHQPIVMESTSRTIPSVNFHLWEPCNMRCKFCFATFQDVKKTILPKGHLPEKEALEVVKKIAEAGFEKITFAGGEPLLCKWLPNLIRTAKELGMTTMIVTNGSMLKESFLQENQPYLDWIAVSIDSLNDEKNIKMGRAKTGKTPLNKKEYYYLIDRINQYGYGLKINTVVNKVNYKDNLTDFIQHANPKRWKVLQVLPIVGQNDTKINDFKITAAQFKHFLKTHIEVKSIIPESNTEIKGSYVMVDPAGRFFDNAQGTHNYSQPILEVGINEALKTMDYDLNKFLNRGGIYDWKRNQNSGKEDDTL